VMMGILSNVLALIPSFIFILWLNIIFISILLLYFEYLRFQQCFFFFPDLLGE
jgi:putative exporter of polyketide antibiotics